MSNADDWERYYAEAEAAATVSALGYRIDPCPRCAAIDEALAEPGTRIFREPNGGIVFVTADFDGDLADVLPEGSRELVPHGPYLPDTTGNAPADELADEPAGEGAVPCQAALVPGVMVCHDIHTGKSRPAGHAPPHTTTGPTSGARITWTDEETTTNG